MQIVDFVTRMFRGDKWMLLMIFLLGFASILAVYSSTTTLAYKEQSGDTTYYVFRHAFYLIISLSLTAWISRIKPRFFAGLAEPAIVLSAFLLVLTLVMGSSINGASRWLSVGGIKFQPSEIAKVAIVVFTAKQLAKHNANPQKAFMPIVLATIVIAGLIVCENMSTCLLICIVVGLMMIFGRIAWTRIIGLGGAGIGLFVCIILFAPYVSKYIPRAETWQKRVERFMNSDEEDSAKNLQAQEAQAAVSIGGLAGVGPGKSYIKNFLPMAFSDFIFSIIMEEWGLFGLIVPVFYVVIFSRARTAAIRNPNLFQVYTILGLASLVCIQAFTNMFVGVGLLPVTGQTLPFVSMGGTSNFIMGTVFGMMLSITAEAEVAKNNQTSNTKREVKQTVSVPDEE